MRLDGGCGAVRAAGEGIPLLSGVGIPPSPPYALRRGESAACGTPGRASPLAPLRSAKGGTCLLALRGARGWNAARRIGGTVSLTVNGTIIEVLV